MVIRRTNGRGYMSSALFHPLDSTRYSTLPVLPVLAFDKTAAQSALVQNAELRSA